MSLANRFEYPKGGSWFCSGTVGHLYDNEKCGVVCVPYDDIEEMSNKELIERVRYHAKHALLMQYYEKWEYLKFLTEEQNWNPKFDGEVIDHLNEMIQISEKVKKYKYKFEHPKDPDEMINFCNIKIHEMMNS